MQVEHRVDLKPYNSFGLSQRAQALVRVRSAADVQAVLADPALSGMPKFVLGGGTNLVITRDIEPLVLKVEMAGMRLLAEDDDAFIIEAGAGESWAALVQWSIDHGWRGLENLAMIPGTVGAAPVQNIGAYGLELQDRFDSLDAIDLAPGPQQGRQVSLSTQDCAFGYRDSVFKHAYAGRLLITRVRFRLPRRWRPELSYKDLARRLELEREAGRLGPQQTPTARDVFNWVCEIRSAKLPDPAVIGNAGSFFKNPVVTEAVCRDIISREPNLVHYPLPDGTYKLAAAWLIDACGWRGKSVADAAVYDKQALVLVNKGHANGGQVITLAKAIIESVYGRFGIRLEPEPVIL